MLINKSTISAVFINLKTEFNKAFTEAQVVWPKIAMRVPSGSGQNNYAWLSNFPKMREWVGEKNIRAFTAYQYIVENKDWEATVEVDRNDLQDDNLGIYLPQAQMAGWSAAQLPDEIVAALVNGAFTAECYDGQYFCDTDHSVAGSSVSNKGTTALAADTQANAIASYGAGRAAMMAFKDDEGRPLGVMPNVLMVPPALADKGAILVNNDRLDDGKPNPYKGTAELVINPRISTATNWFLLDTTKPVKPFIYQERETAKFVQQTEPESDDVFMRKKWKFGAEARAAGGYGFWQLCYGSTGAG